MFCTRQVRGRPDIFLLSPFWKWLSTVKYFSKCSCQGFQHSLSEGINKKTSHLFLISSGPVWGWRPTSSHPHYYNSLFILRSGPFARTLGPRMFDGAGKLPKSLAVLSQDRHPEHPFLRGLMTKDAGLLRNVEVQMPKPGHRGNHQRPSLPFPHHTHSRRLSLLWQ